MPMSSKRVTAAEASFVCRVASTRWPVKDACTAICAVSRSRISPIMITSGSCRKIARSALAKVMSMRGLTCVWPTPARSYSIGSSTVRMFVVVALSIDSAAYRVVVLPEPVGPVTSTMPCGCVIRPSNCFSMGALMPRCCRSRRPASLSSKRNTARSPCPVGRVETRTSTGLPPTRRVMRPSCGKRFSAMSSCAMILMREMSEPWIALRGRTTSRRLPSMRKRTTEVCSNGSMWMSDAPSRSACVSSALIMRMTGASSDDSSKSSMAGTSCSSLVRSRSASNSSAICEASPPPPA